MTTPTLPRDGLQELLAAVDGQRMTATVAALAGESFAGRRTGSAGGAAARAWLGRRLAELGAEVRFDGFTAHSVPETYAAPEVCWHDETEAHGLRFGRQVLPHMASAEQPLVRQGALAVAGDGDPSGRWLVVPQQMSLFEACGHGDGALGLLIRRAPDDDGWHYTMLAGSAPGPVPVLTIDPATHEALRRAAEDRQGWLAGNVPIRRLDVPAANVHARWRPPGILLTAHYDGVGDLPGLRQPSASDNATGVAVVLEAARILAPVLPGFAVTLLDAEEVGALGSAHDARQLRTGGVTPQVINVDGVGVLHDAVSVEAGGPAHALLAALDQAGRHTGVPLKAGPVASDNRRYAAAGFASIGIGAGMAGYHSPADAPDRVQTGAFTTVTQLVVATVWLAAGKLSSLIGD
ncbi:M28 family metallopeptidase [Paractinoplanes toevensis]|uniref:Peptidase M28 domain-containing protein n=1 Tax=Paractinoplanes toevensis TaxID=571911 RepID=A0A919TAS9_9ACTN|nr:M28 family peptidase [Actinoplanes toevensis]GIM91978.1 hypothetical protein Ato02nite_037710 [Actinoplanes toevensis]